LKTIGAAREYGLVTESPTIPASPPTAIQKSCTDNIDHQTDLLSCCLKTTSQHLRLIPQERQNSACLQFVSPIIGRFQYLIVQRLKFQAAILFEVQTTCAKPSTNLGKRFQ
jgi:hypothetical protein